MVSGWSNAENYFMGPSLISGAGGVSLQTAKFDFGPKVEFKSLGATLK
jgi:hypothetical protein